MRFALNTSPSNREASKWHAAPFKNDFKGFSVGEHASGPSRASWGA